MSVFALTFTIICIITISNTSQERNIILDQTVDVHTYVNFRNVTLAVPILTASSNKYCCHKYKYQY